MLTLGSTSFLHVRHENLYIVAIVRSNVDAAMVFEFLYKLVELGKSYFNKLDEEAVKSNFGLVYELLDEIIDFGFPQNTETDTLKQYITTEGVKSQITKVCFASTMAQSLTFSSKYRQKLRCRLQGLFPGDGQMSSIERMKFSLTLWKMSTCC